MQMHTLLYALFRANCGVPCFAFRECLFLRIVTSMASPSSNAAKATMSLAQRFAYHPIEGVHTSPTSVTKRRRLAESVATGSSSTIISYSTSTSSISSQPVSGASKSTSNESLTSAASTSASMSEHDDFDTAIAVVKEVEQKTRLVKGKKRKKESVQPISEIASDPDASPTIPTLLTELPNEVARMFHASLSQARLPGPGGHLSEQELLRLECETLHSSWLNVLRNE